MFILQFIWTPYTDEVIQSLSPVYIAGSDLWRARVPLICWHIVEHHLPDRVLRQFGMIQGIPEYTDTDRGLHRAGLRGTDSTDWRLQHARHLERWEQRRDCIVTAAFTHDVSTMSPEYAAWFMRRTRVLVGNPAHRPRLPAGYQPTGSSTIVLVSYLFVCILL